MAFFDWLESDDENNARLGGVRIPGGAAGSPTVKLKKKGDPLDLTGGIGSGQDLGLQEAPTVDIPEESMGGAAQPSGEDNLSFQKKRASAKDFAFQQATKAVDAIDAILGPKDLGATASKLKSLLFQTQPEQYAATIEKALPKMGYGGVPIDSKAILKPVEDAVGAFKQLQKEWPQGTKSMTPGYVGPPEVPGIQDKVDQLEKEKARLSQAIIDASTDREKRELQTALTGVTQQQAGLKAKIGQGPTTPDVPTFDLQGADKSKTIVGASEAAGVPEKDFLDGISELAKKLGVNTNEPVEFPLALQRLLNHPEFADVRPDFEKMAGPLLPAQPVNPKDWGNGQTPPSPDLDSKIRDTRNLINASRDIKNWGEAIAFVLLSMLIKPQMAILFFSRAQERGQLRAQLDDLMHKRGLREHQQIAAQDEAKMYKKMAIEHMLKRQEQSASGNAALKREIFGIMLKAAVERKKPSADPHIKSMQQDLDNWTKLASQASSAMEVDKAAKYAAKAKQVLDMILQYKAGGGVEEAQPQEAAP